MLQGTPHVCHVDSVGILWVFQNVKAESLDSRRQIISLLENCYITSRIKRWLEEENVYQSPQPITKACMHSFVSKIT